MVARSDRGQLLLLAAVIIAISLMGIVIVLNSVLFAENVADRSATSSLQAVHQHQQETQHDLTKLFDDVKSTEANIGYLHPNETIEHVNSYRDYATIMMTNTQPATTHFEVNLSRSHQYSWIIDDDDSGMFANTSGTAEWELIKEGNVSEIQTFDMTITNPGEISHLEPPAWRITVENTTAQGGNHTWSLVIFADGPGENADIILQSQIDGEDTTQCTVADPDSITIDFINGTIENEEFEDNPCFTFADGVSNGDELRFENDLPDPHEHIPKGTYELFVTGTISEDQFSGPTRPPTGNPYYYHVLGTVSLDYHYTSPDLQYTGELLIPVKDP